ncbi:MAG: carbamoyl-phosphate synthase large subunit [Ferrimicrobium sp.]
MPRDPSITSVLVIGSGPIVIGQACEFDYSGVQACRVLRAEGIRVILANSNPATIMTDPEFADATYIEPLTEEMLCAIIEVERPDALLPTLGGQTALNLAMALHKNGVLERYGVRMIGANPRAIELAENREAFRALLEEDWLQGTSIRGGMARSLADAEAIATSVGYPLMLRPSYILGGAGTGIAHDHDELVSMIVRGISASPVKEVLIEESIAGWKEFELEVMRDRNDNCVVVCSIENLDPMGVHTGDSITVAPIQTLTDQEYQRMRTLAFGILREVGVETGGSNVQFAVDPTTGRLVVVEMNPRVSRSSALASKATGFPIAKIATKLAIGYSLDEIANDITAVTPASFEPSLDYVVVKVPRWVFEKFEGVPAILSTQMQSVGEAMAIGRSFPEALQKALRSIERDRGGLNADLHETRFDAIDDEEVCRLLPIPTPERIFLVESALRRGMDIGEVNRLTGIDPWFLAEVAGICRARVSFQAARFATADAIDVATMRRMKRLGFGDDQLAYLGSFGADEIRRRRRSLGVITTFKAVDTCAGEFAATTPYYYGTFEDDSEVRPLARPSVIILGSGPNRIGQGIEFDYCCVHASYALQEAGFDTVMINSNPETVSTDYDTSSRLYLEPLNAEHVLEVIEVERASGRLKGVIVSFGGQTPLKLAASLDPTMVLGTPVDSIDRAEDREQWSVLCRSLGVRQPPGATVISLEEARSVTASIGFPVLIRPSYVLGGRAMEIVYNDEQLAAAFVRLVSLGDEGVASRTRPILVDRFLESAIEVDVDAVRDREGAFYVGAIMEHVEEAGIHSGDSACVIPPVTLSASVQAEITQITRSLADALGVVGLINVQFAVLGEEVYVIEANPRASRTVPFVAKATGVPLAKLAARVMVGETLEELGASGVFRPARDPQFWSVKEAVLPFARFAEADSVLGPEMRSTGEVMGIDRSVARAFAKAQLAAGTELPSGGTIFLSLANRDKPAGVEIARRAIELGFAIAATEGTAAACGREGVPVSVVVGKVSDERGSSHRLVDGVDGVEADTVDAVELIESHAVGLVINTPRGSGPRVDGYRIRSSALRAKVPCITTIQAARAAIDAIDALRGAPMTVRALQDYHR